MMKHLRILIGLLIAAALLPLSAAGAAKYDYQPVDSDRILCELPQGLSAKVTKADGQLTVLIDSEKTDWDKVVTSMNENGEFMIRLSAAAPNASIQSQIQINNRNNYNPNEETLKERAFNEFDYIIDDELENSELSGRESWNAFDFASFDAESCFILPAPTGEDQYMAYLVVWDPENNPIYEYYFIRFAFTQEYAQKVSIRTVPVNRILPDSGSGITSSVEPGLLTYEVDLGLSSERENVETRILAPEGANSYRYSGSRRLEEVQTIQIDGETVGCMSIGLKKHSYDYAEQYPYAIFWYSDLEGKNLLSYERITIDLSIGDPEPFPRGSDAFSRIAPNRVHALIWTGKEVVSSTDYIKTTYDYDTLRVSVNPDLVPPDVDLNDFSVDVFVTLPDNAAAYATDHNSRGTIYGELSEARENMLERLNDPENREWDSYAFQTFGNDKALYVGGLCISRSSPLKEDPTLHLYSEGENTGKYAGHVTGIRWFRGMDGAEALESAEYLILKLDPFTLTRREPAITDESQLPAPDEMKFPVIILSKGEEITDLYLVIEKSPTSDPHHIYYDLHVEDAFGNVYKLGGDAIVIIPYPQREEMGPNTPHSFKLAHYHNGKKLEYTEENGLLWRTEHGLAFKTSDFSPFVLSWEELPQDSAADLPKTGDSSAPLFLLAFLLAFSLLGFARLRRSRA